jgi:hypothetical protein
LGYAEPTDLAQALAKRLKLDFVVISDLSEDEVDPDALNLLDEETMRKYMALPLSFENGRLIVAIDLRSGFARAGGGRPGELRGGASGSEAPAGLSPDGSIAGTRREPLMIERFGRTALSSVRNPL